MSVVNKVKNFFSRTYISHYDVDGNLKDFEHFRIDLIKELDYMVLRHKFSIIEKTNSAGLFNKVQSSLGNVADDLKKFDLLELIYDLSLLGFYSTTLTL